MRKKSSRDLPRGTWFQRKRLADGTIVRYGYLGRGQGSVALGREGSLEFFDALANVLRKEPVQGTLRSLIWRYRQSPEYRRLRPRTQSDYIKLLDKIDDMFGGLSLDAMAAREMAGHIYRWRDSMQASPRRADYAIQVLKALLAWGHRRGLIEHNRAAAVERLYHSDRRDKIWSADQIAAFMRTSPEPLRRALTLAVETGQRQGDLLILPWSAVLDDSIKLRQQKTGVRVSIPISAQLKACLNSVRRGAAETVLSKADGAAWDPKGNGFRAAWRDAVRAAGISGVTFHDLRGTFVSRQLSAGWSTQEVAMCTGHSLRDLASLDTYANRESIADANAARISERSTSTG